MNTESTDTGTGQQTEEKTAGKESTASPGAIKKFYNGTKEFLHSQTVKHPFIACLIIGGIGATGGYMVGSARNSGASRASAPTYAE